MSAVLEAAARPRAADAAALPTSAPVRRIAGVAVADLALGEALAHVFAAADAGEGAQTRIAFLNAHCANLAVERADYREALARFLVLPDGVGVDIAAKLLHGAPFRANLNGTDFVPAILAEAPRPLRVALLGAAPGVADEAARRFAERFPAHAFAVASHGFLPDEAAIAAALERLGALKADIVLVAMGVPAQELFVDRRLGPAHGRVVLGVGALLDFTAGRVVRAPGIVRALRLEWAWRLAQEPRRLFRRYVLGNPLFLARILRAKLSGANP